MKNKLILLTCLLTLVSYTLFAQTHFVRSGTIEFNKSANIFALMNKELLGYGENNTWGTQSFEAYKKSKPQFATLKSTLIFADGKTLFTPAPPPEGGYNYNYFDIPMAKQSNTVYSDANISLRVSQRTVFEETFLIKDSVNKIKWKITDETREILGYTCRRANGLVLDSVYVVAFYTDQITTVGGPESFTGLPGMILQVNLPHDNVSWIATKVVDQTIPATQLVPPKKGKIATYKEFSKTLNSAIKNWGNEAQDYLKALQL
jgi:GLPGLI family protein